MAKILQTLNILVWGAPALILILGVGIFLTVRTGFAQFTLFPRAIRSFCAAFRRKKHTGDGVSPFQALCTALAATVGTGNLAGVAGAICLGGPGSIFWMWVCGLLGMATKFAEATLAVRYRQEKDGRYLGGPMYMIRQGIGNRFLATAYCIFGVIAAFGVGNATQINAVLDGINSVICRFGGSETQIRNLIIGILLAIPIGAMLLGGAKRIGQAAERLVPFAAGAYILLCLVVLLIRWRQIPMAFSSMIQGAFSPRAVTGGMLGSAFTALRVGCARGVFTNEAGMGTAAIAHGSAVVDHPAQQGLMGIMEVFLDTIVICTMTALVILTSGVPIPYGTDSGAELTVRAFSAVCGGWVDIVITAALCCFAFATVLGWGLYGVRCAEYLWGGRGWKGFALVQTAAVIASSVLDTGIIWTVSETVNGLMAIPNLIALALLSPELAHLTIEFKGKKTAPHV